jgi:hypothetical protein
METPPPARFRCELPIRPKHHAIIRDVLVNGKHRVIKFDDSDWDPKHPKFSVAVPEATAKKMRKYHRPYQVHLTPELAKQEGSGWGSFLGSIIAPLAATGVQIGLQHLTGGGVGPVRVTTVVPAPAGPTTDNNGKPLDASQKSVLAKLSGDALKNALAIVTAYNNVVLTPLEQEATDGPPTAGKEQLARSFLFNEKTTFDMDNGTEDGVPDLGGGWGAGHKIPLTEQQIQKIVKGDSKVRVVHPSKVTESHRMVEFHPTGRQLQRMRSTSRKGHGVELEIKPHQIVRGGAAGAEHGTYEEEEAPPAHGPRDEIEELLERLGIRHPRNDLTRLSNTRLEEMLFTIDQESARNLFWSRATGAYARNLYQYIRQIIRARQAGQGFP